MEDSVLWMFGLAVALFAGIMFGYYAGKEETEAKYNRRWGLEVAARELTQQRHEHERISMKALIVLIATVMILCSGTVAFAQDTAQATSKPAPTLDELKLKAENLDLTYQNLMMKAQLVKDEWAKIQSEIKEKAPVSPVNPGASEKKPETPSKK